MSFKEMVKEYLNKLEEFHCKILNKNATYQDYISLVLSFIKTVYAEPILASHYIDTKLDNLLIGNKDYYPLRINVVYKGKWARENSKEDLENYITRVTYEFSNDYVNSYMKTYYSVEKLIKL